MSVENVLPQGAAESQPSGSQLLSCGQHHGIGSTVFRDREEQFGASTKIETSWGFRRPVPVGRKKNQTGGGRNELGQ